MRLLADENVPLASVRILREAAHDVECAAQFGHGSSDVDVLGYAMSNQRLLVTFDHDFGRLVFAAHFPAPAGIILLRFIPRTPEEPGELLVAPLADESLTFKGRFSVLDRERIRQRLAPNQ